MPPSATASSENGNDPVGPFTGFGNYFAKEIFDWWKSWRLLIVFLIMTTILVLMVFFGFSEEMSGLMGTKDVSREAQGARLLLRMLSPNGVALLIFIIIFSTMGLLTTEKSTGTLAWCLTKPVGRTGLFVAKWLAATTMLWTIMCFLPVIIGAVCMMLYHHVTPDFAKMAPVVGCSIIWIGLWVLISLTISLGFQSQAAVAGILIAFWIVPNILGVVMIFVIGKEWAEWFLDVLATNSSVWTYLAVAHEDLLPPAMRPEKIKNIWLIAFAVWSVVLSVFSLRIFNRQEIGS